MTEPTRPDLDAIRCGKPLTRRQLRRLKASHRRWLKTIQPHLDAIDASTRITSADLKVIIR